MCLLVWLISTDHPLLNFTISSVKVLQITAVHTESLVKGESMVDIYLQMCLLVWLIYVSTDVSTSMVDIYLQMCLL